MQLVNHLLDLFCGPSRRGCQGNNAEERVDRLKVVDTLNVRMISGCFVSFVCDAAFESLVGFGATDVSRLTDDHEDDISRIDSALDHINQKGLRRCIEYPLRLPLATTSRLTVSIRSKPLRLRTSNSRPYLSNLPDHPL